MSIRERIAGARDEGYSAAKTDDVENLYVDNRFSSHFSKTRVKWPLSKRLKIGFQYQLLLNAGQKYCGMLQGEHSAILSTFIKQPFVIKIFLSIFEWPF